ncbi:MAG TPA: GyrI-like domain-containing protein [Caulifigura sp.]|jgi:hypothetical protein|nr:GyrI-like domain-containing protein [Caulifigura sp.]
MQFEILQTPRKFALCGLSAPVPDNRWGEVGLQLMGEMWRLIKESGTPTTGVNHWVYPAEARMFTGVELTGEASAPVGLERLEFELDRHLKHVHVGPYQELRGKWADLKQQLANQGEVMSGYALEIYGHYCDDPSKAETTILIGLAARP